MRSAIISLASHRARQIKRYLKMVQQGRIARTWSLGPVIIISRVPLSWIYWRQKFTPTGKTVSSFWLPGEGKKYDIKAEQMNEISDQDRNNSAGSQGRRHPLSTPRNYRKWSKNSCFCKARAKTGAGKTWQSPTIQQHKRKCFIEFKPILRWPVQINIDFLAARGEM